MQEVLEPQALKGIKGSKALQAHEEVLVPRGQRDQQVKREKLELLDDLDLMEEKATRVIR